MLSHQRFGVDVLPNACLPTLGFIGEAVPELALAQTDANRRAIMQRAFQTLETHRKRRAHSEPSDA